MNPVLMLCHNTVELTKPAIESIRAQDIDQTLYVIDNASMDETQNVLKDNKVLNWRMYPAKGVSASWNFGLDYFFNTAMCEYVWVVNNDVVFRPDTLRELIADGGDFVTGVGVSSMEQIQTPFVKSIRPNPDFSCFLIRKNVWRTIGQFDENMVLYASDADYHIRMHHAGIHAYTIGMPFYHVASGTIKQATDAERNMIQIQANIDRQAFLMKWGCLPGSTDYSARFGPATFGADHAHKKEA